jgi:hypothetical protein
MAMTGAWHLDDVCVQGRVVSANSRLEAITDRSPCAGTGSCE